MASSRPSNEHASWPLPNLADVTLRARQGSCADLEILVQAAKEGRIPVTHENVVTFLLHVATVPGDDAANRMSAVNLALTGLHYCLWRLANEPEDSRHRALLAIVSRWHTICCWMHTLQSCSWCPELSDEVREGIQDRSAEVILEFVVVAAQLPELARCMSLQLPSLQILIETLADLWVRETSSKLKRPVAEALIAVFLYCSDGNDAEEMFIECFSRQEDLAALLLVNLVESLKIKCPGRLKVDAALIMFLCNVKDMGVCLLLRSSTKKFIAVLDWILTKMSAAAVSLEVVDLCLQYFIASAQNSNGSDWVRHALRAGILPLLLRCAEHGNQTKSEGDVILLFIIIMRHLIYKPVLRQAILALQALDLSSTTLDSALPSATDELREALSVFVHLIERRGKIKQTYDTHVRDLCSADSCKISERTAKACRACLRVKYCSKACQISDWPAHKLVCVPLPPKEGLFVVSASISHEEDRFLSEVAKHDLYLFKAEAVKHRATHLAQNPQHVATPFSVKIDYSHVPARIVVAPMVKSPLLIKQAVELRGWKTYVELRLPHGGHTTAKFAFLDVLGDWDWIER